MSPDLVDIEKRLDRLEQGQRELAATLGFDIEAMRALRLDAELAGLRAATAAQRGERMRLVVVTVADVFGVAAHDIRSQLRAEPIVAARFAAVWLIRQLLPVSFATIGAAIGDRDHSSVMNALRQADRRRSRCADYRRLTDELLRVLTPAFTQQGEQA